MRRLLVSVDGSDSAARAFEFALQIAKDNKSISLHLITVHPEPVNYGEIQVYVSTERFEELQRQHSMDILGPLIAKAKAAGVPHTSEIVIGDIAPAIAKKADDLGCSGIVMGTRGMGAIGNLVLGSVATKVLHLTNLPVTLVK